MQKPPFGTINNPIQTMEYEHQAAGNILKVMSELTNHYTPPEGACATFQVTYKYLKDFEEDLHQHIHLENNILFPNAVNLEDIIFHG